MNAPVNVLTVMNDCRNGLHAARMTVAALELQKAKLAVVELIDALRECAEAEQPMAQMHATERARAALARVGGAS